MIFSRNILSYRRSSTFPYELMSLITQTENVLKHHSKIALFAFMLDHAARPMSSDYLLTTLFGRLNVNGVPISNQEQPVSCSLVGSL